VPLGGMCEVGPLAVLNRDEFALALNPVGSINVSYSESKLLALGETDEFEPE